MNDSSAVFLSRRKRSLIWFTLLVLILACAPLAPTPIPPLNPNDINLFIKQTADAASIQTLAALPTSTFTPTFTATPANTYTPEPTLTPIQTFVLATPTKAQTVQFFRVKHDTQLEIYNYRARTAGEEWTYSQAAEVVPLLAAAKNGSATQRTTINKPWEAYMDALNGFDRGKLIYLKGTETALFNGAGFPQLESLTMGGNILTLNEIQGNWGRVNTMDYGSPGSAETDNYTTRPDLVHKFVVVVWSRKSKSTYWVNPPKGDVYWPLVSNHTLWIQMDRLEPFPFLPMLVTATTEQDIMKEPKSGSESTGKTLAVGESVTITQYYPSGSSVWARLQSGRWITLFRYTKAGPTYFTSWKMETLPPPP